MRSSRAGFSFIEIMLILLLLGLVATMAIPQFFAMIERDEQLEFRNLLRVMKMLRNEAILKNNRYAIVFDIEKQKYHVELLQKEGGKKVLNEPKVLRAHEFPKDLKLQDVARPSNFTDVEHSREFKLGFVRKPIPVTVDSSGFVTPVLLFFKKEEQSWVVRNTNIMGQLVMEEFEDSPFL